MEDNKREKKVNEGEDIVMLKKRNAIFYRGIVKILL